ncbi:MAG: AI-2E family transporter [Chloroflexota bacterium]|nr:AI-2E family transporter [Chloroflexota bacterium]
MNAPHLPPVTVPPIAPSVAAPTPRVVLNRWLQIFLTLIAGTVVAVIAWTILERFQHIIVLLLASFILSLLLGPLVDLLERRHVPRLLGTGIAFLLLIAVLGLFGTLMLGPLISQLQDVLNKVPTLVSNRSSWLAGIDRFFRDNGIPLQTGALQDQIGASISSTSTALLGGTLSVVTGVVGLVTDLFLILAITFYLIVDGGSIRSHILALFPARARERWFFIEATVNSVLGGYIRGQVVVALTVGAAAGLGSALLGVQYPLVIGLLAFLFEFIPLLGPVLGMIPAVLISLFQPFPLVLWVILYFIVLQQVESNLIVPRVSGRAVGLHPLGAMLALIAGVEVGGLGGALISVPLVGMLYVLGLAIYSDMTHQTSIFRTPPRRAVVPSLQAMIGRRGAPVEPTPPEGTPQAAIGERLNTLAQDQADRIEQFEAQEAVTTTETTTTTTTTAATEPATKPAPPLPQP